MNARRLAVARPEPASSPPGRLRDYAWLEQRLGVKRSTLACWVSRGQLPCVRLGPRSTRFDENAIEAWLAARVDGGRS